MVSCHRILQFKDAVSAEACEVWAVLGICYNESRSAKYRDAATPNDAILLRRAIAKFADLIKRSIELDSCEQVFRNYVSNQFKITKSLLRANFSLAKARFEEADYGNTILYLETALSAVHDLLDALTSELTE